MTKPVKSSDAVAKTEVVKPKAIRKNKMPRRRRAVQRSVTLTGQTMEALEFLEGHISSIPGAKFDFDSLVNGLIRREADNLRHGT